MESWQKDFLKEIIQLTQKNVCELNSLMVCIGIDDKMKLEWISSLRESIQESYGQMQENVKKFRNKIIDNIEELLQKSENFCKQLRTQMPEYRSANLSLIEEQNLLKSRINEYESKIKERLEQIKILNKRQTIACSSLGREPILFPDSQLLPTMEEISDFTNHIEELENEKYKRETRFLEGKCKILDIINELGIKPSLKIEKTLCSPDDSLFMVTDHDMKWLDECYESIVEIVRFWEKCHFTTSERAEFNFFQHDLFTEDLLTFHNIELDRMKKYYEENKEIFLKLEKLEAFCKRKLELKDKAADPNRFKNRGGIILKESREKAALTKKINRLERDLLQLAEDYEKKHHKVFLSWGRPISDIIAETRNEFEKNKKQQLSDKKFHRANTPTPGKSTSTVGTSGLISASKGKAPSTKLFSSSKKRTPGKEGLSKAGHSLIPKMKFTKMNVDDMTLNQRKKIRYSHGKIKHREETRRLSKLLKTQKIVRAANESIDDQDYQEEGMNEREACCSTIFSGPSCSSISAKVTPSKP